MENLYLHICLFICLWTGVWKEQSKVCTCGDPIVEWFFVRTARAEDSDTAILSLKLTMLYVSINQSIQLSFLTIN